MFRPSIVALGLAVLTLLLPMPVAAEPLPPASQWVPQNAVIALEVSQPKAVLDLAIDPEMIEAVESLPVYQRAAKEAKFREFLTGVAFLEARLGVKWPEALHKLLGGGVMLTVHPHNGVLLVVDAKDQELLGELHEVLVAIAQGEAKKAGQPDRIKSKEYAGVTVWTFGGDEAHAIVGSRFLLTNRPALLQEVLDLRAEPGASLAALPAYQAARKAVGPEAVGTVFVNMEVLKQIPQVEKALENNEQPMAALLFAAITDALRQAHWMGLGFELRDKTLVLRATVDDQAKASPRAAFTIPDQPGQGALPNLDVPGRIAGLTLYRDLHGFYAAKDELFPERTSGLIFFENMMGIFFSGRDLTEEVLGQTKPETRLVVALPKYDPAIGTPRLRIPSFAAVFHLRDAERAALVAEEAWQKAIGLINITRGQKAQPGLILDRVEHQDVRFSVAYFPKTAEDDEEDLDLRFNFRPALARVGEFLVLSSTEALAKDLIDAIKQQTAEPVQALARIHSRMEIEGPRLAAVLQANRDALVRQNMVKEGKTQDQAEMEFDVLVNLIRSLGRARLDVGSPKGPQEARLEVELNLP